MSAACVFWLYHTGMEKGCVWQEKTTRHSWSDPYLIIYPSLYCNVQRSVIQFSSVQLTLTTSAAVHNKADSLSLSHTHSFTHIRVGRLSGYGTSPKWLGTSVSRWSPVEPEPNSSGSSPRQPGSVCVCVEMGKAHVGIEMKCSNCNQFKGNNVTDISTLRVLTLSLLRSCMVKQQQKQYTIYSNNVREHNNNHAHKRSND